MGLVRLFGMKRHDKHMLNKVVISMMIMRRMMTMMLMLVVMMIMKVMMMIMMMMMMTMMQMRERLSGWKDKKCAAQELGSLAFSTFVIPILLLIIIIMMLHQK